MGCDIITIQKFVAVCRISVLMCFDTSQRHSYVSYGCKQAEQHMLT